jgi:DnaJ-domain-containing protein 1
MFERQRSSAIGSDARMSVALTMNDGEVLRGNLRLPLSGKLFDAMNNADLFFDFETPEGERLFLAKHSIRKVQAFELPRTDQLAKRNADKGIFDPYAVLGVPQGADAQTLKHAYLNLARTYHPDRFAGIELPREMRDYANAMLTRINVAYQQLQG